MGVGVAVPGQLDGPDAEARAFGESRPGRGSRRRAVAGTARASRIPTAPAGMSSASATSGIRCAASFLTGR